MGEWAQTSIYLTADEQAIVERLKEQTGLSRSEIFRRAIRLFYEHGDFSDGRNKRLLEIADEIRSLA